MSSAKLAVGLTLVAVLSSGVVAAPDTGRTEAASSQPFPPPEARRAPGAKDSPEVISLLQQRRDAVKVEVDLARPHIGEPNFRSDVWSALVERLLVAETDAADTPAARIAACRNFRDNLKLLEDQWQRVPEPVRGQGYFEYGQKLWIHSRRLQAEAALLREELSDRKPPVSVDDSPALRAAILAWRDAVREWAKMWLTSRIPLIPGLAREIATTSLNAELAAARDQTEVTAAYRLYRDQLRAVEKDTKFEVERRRYNPLDHLKIVEMRCDADIQLAGLASGKDKPLDKDAPQVRAALDDWKQAVGFEGDLLRRRFDAGKVPAVESLMVDESLLQMELAVATKPDERLTAYKRLLTKLKEAETSLKARADNNPAIKFDLLRVTYNRAATELTMLQLATAAGTKTLAEAKILLNEKRDALKTELDLRMADWKAGRSDFQSLQESAGNLLLAELDLAGTPSDKLAAYKAHADRMRTAESQCKALLDAKKGEPIWIVWASEARTEAEIWLLRAKQNLAGMPTP
jgi:hypothetical protein